MDLEKIRPDRPRQIRALQMTQLNKTAIRDAATIVLVRDPDSNASVLMGQRGATAAFMPSKYVFPGGAVDPQDQSIDLGKTLSEGCARKLELRPITTPAPTAQTLAAAAIRELWEETGLRLGRQGTPPSAPPSEWESFYASGVCPDASALRFMFRAVTPPGPPRRFDARFFIAPASAVLDNLDDFTNASDELSHLHWVPLTEVRTLDLPFVTEVALAEIRTLLPRLDAPKDVPFVSNENIARMEML